MIQIDETKYYIVKERLTHGVVTFTCKEKRRNCEKCQIQTDTRKMQILHWTDREQYRRAKELCHRCYDKLKVFVK